MSSLVVYDLTQSGDVLQRQSGMREAAERAISKLPTNDANQIIIKTIDDLVAHADFDVRYIDRDTQNEFTIRLDGAAGSGKYKYNNGSFDVKLKIVAKVDHESSPRNETMHVTAPRDDTIDVTSSGYLAKIIGDVGGTWSENRAKYMFGTVLFRRCR